MGIQRASTSLKFSQAIPFNDIEKHHFYSCKIQLPFGAEIQSRSNLSFGCRKMGKAMDGPLACKQWIWKDLTFLSKVESLSQENQKIFQQIKIKKISPNFELHISIIGKPEAAFR